MPWKTGTVEMQRKEFIKEALSQEESFSAVCRKYGITRRTGYKWLERYRSGTGLDNQSKAPRTQSRKTPQELEELVLKTRAEHPTWGGRKLHRFLSERGYAVLPAPSTITGILRRHDCIDPDAHQKNAPCKRFTRDCPNDLWQMDFKGHFPMLDGNRCHPLTMTDDHSRRLLCLDAKENERWEGVKTSLLRVFEEFGLPDSILSDNGFPWGNSKQGYTPFELWMMQMNILPIHGRPFHPQTQGKQERFHRTLNEDLIRRVPMRDLAHAQYEFDQYSYVYNYERPHAALALDVPDQHYQPSPRRMPSALKEPEYSGEKRLRKVNYKGYVSIQRHRYYLSETFADKYLSCEYEDNDCVSLCYGSFQIAKIDLNEQLFVSRRILRK